MGEYLSHDVDIVIGIDRIGIIQKAAPVFHRLTLGEAIAISLIAESGSVRTAASQCEKILPNGRELVRDVHGRFITYFGRGTSRPFPLEKFKKTITALGNKGEDSDRNESPAAPQSVTWYTSYSCKRRCVYCKLRDFRKTAFSDNSVLSGASITGVVHEMALIGTPDLYLTGGEPLLRPDLHEIIAEASSVRVRTHLITKFAIDRSLARRLSNAGLKSATISLDSCRERELSFLTGCETYLKEATLSITSLQSFGIPVAVNAVVTSVNAESLDDLAAYLIKLYVPKLQLSEYTVSDLQGRPRSDLVPDTSASFLVNGLQYRHGDKIEVEGGNLPLSPSQALSANSICSNGRIGLPLLPDGSVVCCPNIPLARELTFGNIGGSKLLEIWNSPIRVKIIKPARGLYAGTLCAECPQFDVCNSRGRCYFSARHKHGQTHAPDEFCTLNNASPRAIT